ncbi:MAG: hypothetical protein COA44_06220 [Arcobacter sp.]|nr:MAG: hypothetical protein COA44_06220 [Arcobacter sp.]
MLQVTTKLPDIPNGTAIPCPEIGFKWRKVSSCLNCPFFNGFGIMSTDTLLPFDKQYAVRCSHVIERRTTILEVHD